MLTQRRLQYLEAMGIDVWVRRQPGRREVLPHPAGVDDVTGAPVAPVASVVPAHEDWAALAAEVRDCQRCGLRQGCRQTVFGVGDRAAKWLIVGEAPGADEDRQGEPFVGRAGQLLNNMLLAIGLERDQVFIANVIKCRPPANRDPEPEEVLTCAPYLQRQIALLQPRIILAVGRIAAQHLLQSTRPVGQLRNTVHTCGAQRTPLVVTYHPAYLLRSPREKAKAWADMQLARRACHDAVRGQAS